MSSNLNDAVSEKEQITEEQKLNIEQQLKKLESDEVTSDPIEPGKTETLSPSSYDPEIDKLIGRGLKLPPVQSDGLW